MNTQVLIIMGSDSDLPIMEEACKLLKAFSVPFEMTIASAHRSPDRLHRIVENAEKKGVSVIIAGAGAAAHLAGVVASHTILPVIGVPIDSSPLRGIDSLFSTVQMPPGIPVATMAVGMAGAKNAAILAVEMLALTDPKLQKRLRSFREKMTKEVEDKANALKNRDCGH